MGITVELQAEVAPSLAGVGPPDSDGVRTVTSLAGLLLATSSELAALMHLSCVE